MLKKTPLHAQHKKLGARLVDFGGWEMPVQYRGVIEEHLATRNAAGLFDVSHMGEIEVRGKGALAYIQELTVNDASRLSQRAGAVQRLLLPAWRRGGRCHAVSVFSPNIISSASMPPIPRRISPGWRRFWKKGHFPKSSCATAATNSPRSPCRDQPRRPSSAGLTDTDLDSIAYYHFHEGRVAEVPAIISRTGYTGEDGFELYFAPEAAEKIWTALLEVGVPDGSAAGWPGRPRHLAAGDEIRSLRP